MNDSELSPSGFQVWWSRVPAENRPKIVFGAFVAFLCVGLMVLAAALSKDQPSQGPSDGEWRTHCYSVYLDPSRTDLAGNPVPRDESGWASCIALGG